MTQIVTVLGALIAFLGRKLSMAGTTIASFFLLTAAMIACINSILDSILAALTIPPWIAGSVGLFIPGNFTAVLSAIMSSYICRAAYDMAIGKIKAINTAT